MRVNNNALVLLWMGENLPDYLVEKIAEILLNNGICIPEMLTIKYKDEDGLANTLIRDANTNKIQFETVDNSNNIAEAVKQSVIYIGKRFEASLKGTNGNLALFALELNAACISARDIISFSGTNSGTEILKAVEILATTDAIIPSPLAKKYHFTQNVVEVIKKVYQRTISLYVSRTIQVWQDSAVQNRHSSSRECPALPPPEEQERLFKLRRLVNQTSDLTVRGFYRPLLVK